MVAPEHTNDWRELREFSGVDLENSYVLSWSVTVGTLVIDVDVCLDAQHPFYEPPRPSETSCIRAGVLEFPYCTSLRAENGRASSTDPNVVAGTLRHGKITGLTRIGDGRYDLRGAFGRVCIEGERPLLRFSNRNY